MALTTSACDDGVSRKAGRLRPLAARSSPPRPSARELARARDPQTGLWSTASSATPARDELRPDPAPSRAGGVADGGLGPGQHPGLAAGRLLRLRPPLRLAHVGYRGPGSATRPCRTSTPSTPSTAWSSPPPTDHRDGRDRPGHQPRPWSRRRGWSPVQGRRRFGLQGMPAGCRRRPTSGPTPTGSERRTPGRSSTPRGAGLVPADPRRRDPVVVMLGDHQPATIVSGPDAGFDVPVAVIARDPAVLDAIDGWGWGDGLRPDADAPVWRMDAFRDEFLAAYGPNGHTGSCPPRALNRCRPRRIPGGGCDARGRCRADAQLHEEHADVLWRFCLRLVGNDRAHAEDVAQETLLRAWRHRDVLAARRPPCEPGCSPSPATSSSTTGAAAAPAPRLLSPTSPSSARRRRQRPAAAVLGRGRGAHAPFHRPPRRAARVLLPRPPRGRGRQRLGVPEGTVKSRTHYALRALSWRSRRWG